MEEAVHLTVFPFSLTGESKIWYNELEPESITTWEQMREKFVRRFFPSCLVARLLKEIWGFQQHDSESLSEAWLRFRKMLRNCHGHGLSREQIIQIFYHGLDSQSAAILGVSSGGSQPLERMGDRNLDTPMWKRTRNVAPTPKSAIVQPSLGDNFAIKGYIVKMIRERQFDGRVWADPYEHVVDFLKICGLFVCGTDMEEAVRLKLFPFSLTGESKIWYDELEPEFITTWEQMREKFIGRFFPSCLVARSLNEIRGFQQCDSESLVEAWLRIKKMLRTCHGHGLSRELIIQIFYHGLDSQSAGILDVSSGVIFLNLSSNAAYQMLEDKVLFNYDWSRTPMDKPAHRIAASVEGVGHCSVVVSKLDALSRKFDNQLKSLEGEIKELQEGCGNDAWDIRHQMR